MWLKGIVFVTSVSLWLSVIPIAEGKRVVCYYQSAAAYRSGQGKYDIEDIDYNLCTHLIYVNLGINSDGSVRILDSWNEIEKGALIRFSSLKLKNPCLKVLFTIGGWNEGSIMFSNMAKDSNKRTAFVNSALKFLQTYNYDGFDLDWEYPNQRGGIPSDVSNFVQLLKEIRNVTDKHGYLLSATVAAVKSSARLSYDIPQIVKYLDFINLQTYNLAETWDGAAGTRHSAPLYPSVNDLEKELNVDACISFWIQYGAPPEKLNLGISFYDQEFTTVTSAVCEIGFATRGNIKTLAYYEAAYARSRNLGGAAVWTVDADDSKGSCDSWIKYPLLRAVRTGLGLSNTPNQGCSCGAGTGCNGYRIVCYYRSWAVYRPGEGKFDVEDIDPNLCTHIIFGFIGLTSYDGKPRILDSWNEVDKAAFERFTCLKKMNPNLKALVAIGGWNEGSLSYSAVAGDPARRATFQGSIINLIKTYGFDGLDLDWEYPNQRGGVPADVANFVTWIRELRAAFDKEGLLLTAAVAACETSASLSYNIPEVSKYLDFIDIMTYDMHGCWDAGTAHNAPLRNSPDLLDVETCVSHWLGKGAPPEKLNLGIAFYGRGWTLSNTNNVGLGAPTSACGQAGPYTRENGIMGYNEICRNNWPRKWHDEQKVPYVAQGNQWFGYDDPESIKHKIDFLKSKGLGGAMVWSLETDDFLALCGGGRNPLLNAIRTGLGLSASTGTGWGSPCANRTITWWSPPADNGGGGGTNPGTDPGTNPGTDPGNGGGGTNPSEPPAAPTG